MRAQRRHQRGDRQLVGDRPRAETVGKRSGAEAVGNRAGPDDRAAHDRAADDRADRPAFHGRAIDSPADIGGSGTAGALRYRRRRRRIGFRLAVDMGGHRCGSARRADRVDSCRRQAALGPEIPRAANWRSQVIEAYAEGAALHDSIGLAQTPGSSDGEDAGVRWSGLQARADDYTRTLYRLREAAPDDEARMRVADTLGSLQALLSAITAERASGRDLQASAAETVRSRLSFFAASLQALRLPDERPVYPSFHPPRMTGAPSSAADPPASAADRLALPRPRRR